MRDNVSLGISRFRSNVTMRLFFVGRWQDRDQHLEVRNPFDATVIDTVPKAEADDVEKALAAAVEGAEIMRKMSGYERAQILRKTADLMGQRVQELGRLISMDEGKTHTKRHNKAKQTIETMDLSAEEAKRISGEVLPLD